MNPRHRYSFDLKWHIRELVLWLLRSSGQQATLFDISKVLRCDIQSLKMEIASQIQKYPTLCYIPQSEIIMLSSKGFALFSVISCVLKETKRLFFVPWRLERILYEMAAKSENVNNFWDNIQTLIWTSDPLSSFLLRHLIGAATLEFGPLGSTYVDDTIKWATTISVCSTDSRYQYLRATSRFRLLATSNQLRACLTFVKGSPVFVKKDIQKDEFIDQEKVLMLEDLGIISFNSKRKMYNLRLAPIFPWNLNWCVKFLVTEDYCRRIFRDFELHLENPLSVTTTSDLLLRLLKVARAPNEGEPVWNILSILRDFCSNIESIFLGSTRFSMKISLPLSLEDPRAFGRILWAVKDIPKIVESMPFEWFRNVLTNAIETSRLIGAVTGIPDLSGDDAIFFTSPPVAEVISTVAQNFGMLHQTHYHEYGKTLKFDSRRDLKRIGLISHVGVDQKGDEIWSEGFIFEILNEVLRIRPRYSISLKKLAAKLEVDPDFLLDFIKSHLSDFVDASIPEQISPLKNPWLKL